MDGWSGFEVSRGERGEGRGKYIYCKRESGMKMSWMENWRIVGMNIVS
jgi:hypothetical protein